MANRARLRRLATDALSAEGRRSLAARLASRVAERVPPGLLQHHLDPADLVETPVDLSPGPPRPVGTPLRVGWVITPPGPGSGGHTTLFRMVAAVRSAGHENVLSLYDPFHGDLAGQEGVIRDGWPGLSATVRPFARGLDGLDVCVASSWQTAHALVTATRKMRMHRCYFIQDFEPFFYPRGFEYDLAKSTYGFGLHNISLGNMVHEHLARAGMPTTTVPFGCDTDTYRLTGTATRSGVVLYSRAGTPRRGFLLAKLALEEFHRMRPDVPIGIYGPGPMPAIDVPATHHGRLTPSQLNELYNKSVCGLGLSFTNISLVVGEMLAAGCVPVVNDCPDARAGATSPHVAWSPATPAAIAATLARVTDNPPAPAAVAGSVTTTWADTGTAFVAALHDVCYAPGSSGPLD